MRKVLSTLAAAATGLGVMVGLSSAAHAFVPLVLAAIIGGSIIGGAVIGSAVTSPTYTTGVARGPVVVQPTCSYTRMWVGDAWQRVRVCNND